MKQNYFTLLFLFFATTTVFSQPAEFPKFFPFHTRQSPAATNRSASNNPQRAKALNQSAQTTYTHRIDSIVGTIDVTSTSLIKNYMRMNCKYSGNQLREMTCYTWDYDGNVYVPAYTCKYTYDTQSRVDSFYTYHYSETTGKMYVYEVIHYEYDSSNRISCLRDLYWDSYWNEWGIDTVIYYQYAGLNMSSELFHIGDSPDLHSVVNHFADACNNDTLVKKYYYTNIRKYLSSLHRMQYKYNANNDIEESYDTRLYVNPDDSTIQEVAEIVHSVYDKNGNLSTYSDNHYNSYSEEPSWVESYTTADIDLNYKTTEILGYDKLELPISPKNLTKQWNVTSVGRAFIYKLYYSPLTRDGLTQIGTLGTVKVLSGAMQGTVSLQMPTEAAYRVSVFNASGYQLQNIQTNGAIVTLSKLPAGVYFYHCRSEAQNYKGKFIVQ